MCPSDTRFLGGRERERRALREAGGQRRAQLQRGALCRGAGWLQSQLHGRDAISCYPVWVDLHAP